MWREAPYRAIDLIRSRCILYCAGPSRGIQHTRQRRQALALRAGFSTLALEERCRGEGRSRGKASVLAYHSFCHQPCIFDRPRLLDSSSETTTGR